jgi:acylphosphatase
LSSVAAELIITGVVQGVGYRYFCYKKAKELGVIGWVSNQHDGSVFCWAEGDRAVINEFIVELKLGPAASSIRDVIVKWHDSTGEYSSFNIEKR